MPLADAAAMPLRHWPCQRHFQIFSLLLLILADAATRCRLHADMPLIRCRYAVAYVANDAAALCLPPHAFAKIIITLLLIFSRFRYASDAYADMPCSFVAMILPPCADWRLLRWRR